MRHILEQALTWIPSQAELTLFVAMPPQVADARLQMKNAETVPDRVSFLALEDVAGIIPSHHLVAFDAVFDRVPENLDAYIENCLREALRAGADVAWFAFEGSFHFEHVLTADIASHVYAVADATGCTLALDDDLRSSESWRARLAGARNTLTDR